ncbi:MAG: PIG-L family deacetylase [Anaerolineae bacterium]|nr:PIG-L family deacetylase [Anaerolineae bacterium]
MHVFLAPHADDAPLSCGAYIATLTARGEAVRIITLMMGNPSPDFKGTAFTRELEERWEAGVNPYARRRDEDRAAAAILGAQIDFADYPDAAYRADAFGNALYPTWEAITTQFNPRDQDLPLKIVQMLAPGASIANPIPNLTMYFPLGAGGHVDHRIVRDVGKLLLYHPFISVRFYEDYPYNFKDQQAVFDALKSFGNTLIPRVLPSSEEAIAKKIAAVACYKSQLSSFWKDELEMNRALREFTLQHGEIEWQLPPKEPK